MMHLRAVIPSETTDAALALLQESDVAVNIVLHRGAAVQPPGDLLTCDVPRESANDVIDRLCELGIDSEGAISLEDVALIMSAGADRAEQRAPGLGSDAVVWEQIEQRTGDDSKLTWTFAVFLIVATVIAGIGVLLDQPILIVGAMVVGPEFGPLAALCVGLVRGRTALIRRSLIALVVGFPVAMAVTVLATLGLAALGLVDRQMLLEPRPLTDFIWRPDALSWIIGFLAGVAGMLSLTSAKSGALIGVLISVTTVPAAGNVAVALAFGVLDEAVGSLLQLLINLVAIVLAGVLTLLVQRVAQRDGRARAAQ